MPQLVPTYFVSQVTFGFLVLIILIYVYSKFILPLYLQIFVTRIAISKIQNSEDKKYKQKKKIKNDK